MNLKEIKRQRCLDGRNARRAGVFTFRVRESLDYPRRRSVKDVRSRKHMSRYPDIRRSEISGTRCYIIRSTWTALPRYLYLPDGKMATIRLTQMALEPAGYTPYVLPILCWFLGPGGSMPRGVAACLWCAHVSTERPGYRTWRNILECQIRQVPPQETNVCVEIA